MRASRLIWLVGIVTAVPGTTPRHELPSLRPNSNIERAGTLEHGVLTVALEAKESQWVDEGSGNRPLRLAAFSEVGKPPLLPGPLIRAPQGTEIRLTVHNALAIPLTFLLPAAMRGGPDNPDAMDSLVLAPGAVRQMTIGASVPGNYVYRATARDDASMVNGKAGALAGAIVIDSAGATDRPRDRVLVIMALPDSPWVAAVDSLGRQILTGRSGPSLIGRIGQFTYTINGRSWPNTERIAATAGDTLHWRVINASNQLHAMHLHGFYFRVDALSGGLTDRFPRPAPGQMVVTQLLAPLGSMSMTWAPERPGNWLFHCHFAIHLVSDPHLAGPNARHPSGDMGMQDMSGMALGVVVADRPGASRDPVPAAVRRLRLVAEKGAAPGGDGVIDTMSAMRFVLVEHGRRVEGTAELSPELDLVRGEPVSITIVNHLAEATSVHWHGIEVQDSYVDGVPGFSGSGKHLEPEIAPGDSLTVQFTPPRSGTFMYHAHVDELREQLAGLEGALVVRDSGAPSADDHAFFLKGLGRDPGYPNELNGQSNPDTVILYVGRPARLRLLNLSTNALAPVFSLTARPDSAMTIARDTMLVEWRPHAKDGFDVPAAVRRLVPGQHIVGIGETYDFEYVPSHVGNLRLEVRGRGPGTPLMARVPIRVE